MLKNILVLFMTLLSVLLSGEAAWCAEDGLITGTVVDAASGKGLATVPVAVYDDAGITISSTYTLPGGVYAIAAPPGSYKVAVKESRYTNVWYGNATSYDSAATISVLPSAKVENVDFSLRMKGGLSGKVRDSQTGLPVAYAQITASPEGASWSIDTWTDGQGNISNFLVPDGNYKLLIERSDYVPVWYLHAASKADATTVTVTGPSITPLVDIKLVKKASIAGRITDKATGSGIGGLNVYACKDNCTSPLYGYTDDLGNYAIDALDNGTYKLHVDASHSGYLSQWYDNAQDIASARGIAVAAPESVTGINFMLSRSGVISGKVIEMPSGLPVGQVSVRLFGTQKKSTYYASTDAYGEYLVNIPEDDTYLVQFIKSGFLDQWYNLKQFEADAQSIMVKAPTIVTGINGVLTLPGSIAGRITDGLSGAPIQGVKVELYDDKNNSRKAVYSDVEGGYKLTGLAGGSYKVKYVSSGYMPVWYADAKEIGAATMVAVSPPTTTTINVALARLGSISGRVADKVTGSGVEGSVAVYDCSSGKPVVFRYADADGNYLINNLTPGCYKVSFEKYLYMGQWYDGQPDMKSALDVTVMPGLTTSGINGLLFMKGGMAGNVLDGITGEGLPGITVEAYDYATGYLVSTTTTDTLGSYRLLYLPDNRYKLRFSGKEYLSRYYTEAGAQNPTPVEVKAPSVIQVNTVMVKVGSISGTVTDRATGKGVAGLAVVAYDAEGGVWAASTVTDTAGDYLLGQLKEGLYKVKFDGGGISSSGYNSQWYDGKESMDAATKVSVTATKAATGINAALDRGGSISGRVTEMLAGAGIPGVYVAAIDSKSGYWVNSTTTGADGVYVISGLPGGDYRIRFSEYEKGYLSQWFDNKPGIACSDVVHLAQSEARIGIDAVLVKGGSISGKVADQETGAGLGNATVLAEDAGSRLTFRAVTHQDGSYVLKGLPDGSYTVSFGKHGYVALRYSLPPGADKPTPIPVTAAHDLTGIDAVMTRGLSVSGRVSDMSSGKGISGAYVSAYEQAGGEVVSYALTDATGSYTLRGLKSGTYDLLFSSPGYIKEWYGSFLNRSEASPVLVAAAETTGIDASLEKGGSLSGTVTDSVSGVGVGYVQVTAYDAITGNPVDIATTDFLGGYTFSGLPSGTYNVRFDGRSSAMGGYLSSWYKDARTRLDAIPLKVSAPDELTGIDATLGRGGSISGTITINSCPSPEAVQVKAYNAITGELVSSPLVWTGYTTNFTIDGLPGGSYKIEFDTLDSGFFRQWYNNRDDMVQAEILRISGFEKVTGIDVSILPGGGSISGIVTDKKKKGIAFLEVKFYSAFTQGLVGTAHTDQNGKYLLKGLKTGSYLVFFGDSAQFAGRWFNWKGQKKPSIVTVRAPGVVTGIDGVLSAVSEKDPDDNEDSESEEIGPVLKKKRR